MREREREREREKERERVHVYVCAHMCIGMFFLSFGFTGVRLFISCVFSSVAKFVWLDFSF